MTETELPETPFLTYNAVASDLNTNERLTMRKEIFNAEPVAGDLLHNSTQTV